MKKKITILFLLSLLPFLSSKAYNYSYYGDVLHSSPGYNYITHFDQQRLDVKYKDPQDIKYYNETIYLLAKDDDNSDIILIMDKNFNVLDVVKEFNLTNPYKETIQKEVDNAFEMIENMYQDLFSNTIIYPEIKIPFDNINKIIESIEASWTSSKPEIVTDSGITSNDTDEVVTAELELEMTLWGQTKSLNFEVNVVPKIENVKGLKEGFSYSLSEDVLLSDLNEVFKTEFDDLSYLTVKELIEAQLPLEKNEFIYENYRFTFKITDEEDVVDEENEITFYEIKMEKMEAEDDLLVSKIHGSMFLEKYKTAKARGIEVVESGIYLADTENGRILKLNHDFEVIDAFYDVDDDTFISHVYKPLKITVDTSERMYVIASGVFEGIIELDSKGNFNRYTGVNPIKLTPLEVLKRFLMTEAQRAKLQKYLPTDFTNLVLNEKSFIFATAKPREGIAENMIQLINPKGVDVLKRNGYHRPIGDIIYVEGKNNYVIEGPSNLVDIALGENGIYSVLDAKRSRIFTYDSEGNLLYVNGDKGIQSDKFTGGVALEYIENNLVVVDQTGTILVYRPTEFGDAVNQAVKHYTKGEFYEASLEWEKVLKLNTNYEIAYNGIGRYYLREKNYQEAMKNFKLGHDRYYYSKAFKEQRNLYIKENFLKFIGGTLALIAVVVVLKVVVNKRKGRIK
ncbi:MAG: hypothetical protein RBS76_02910 [Acholeplasmatales bacterium]|jgi:tetratricopeptide (TPR) repeat protein|nr:hypothetical protein [Acholeplasmataceae bacterium]MCK9289543.1 hypothetical protein [Acholeplasmataceae bacterium]MCK9427595.1 hypothetical protein [Acholeplasmataceae bacterium]MDY0115433.1 hypothetical protein [Acholeplasmatales bacterium]HHT38849.1 hypothetical protein [Acholeplasmataceae bacterium]